MVLILSNGGSLMSEETRNAQQVLGEARPAFQGTRYTSASDLFAEAAVLEPGNLEASMYAVVSRFMAGERHGAELMPVWEQIKPMLEAVIARGPADGDDWDFRDPKVQKIGDTYHMVLGNSANGIGRVVRYT